jgi:hypothetical protein
MAGGGSGAGRFGAAEGPRGFALGDLEAERAPTAEPSSGQLAAPVEGVARAAVVPPGYLASLDIELPKRGEEFLFTTPRGDIEITAQSIAQETIDRLTMIAVILVGALVVWWLSRAVKAILAPGVTA